MAAGHERSDAHVRHPQVLQALDSELCVNDSFPIVISTHLRRTRHVPAGCGRVCGVLQDICLGHARRHREERIGPFGDGRAGQDRMHGARCVDKARAIESRVEEIWVADGRIEGIGRFQGNRAFGLWLHHDDYEGEVRLGGLLLRMQSGRMRYQLPNRNRRIFKVVLQLSRNVSKLFGFSETFRRVEPTCCA